MKYQKIVALLSNILFYIGAGLSVLAIILTVTVRASLPPGVCPIDTNRPLYFVSIGILMISLFMSLYAGRLKKIEISKK